MKVREIATDFSTRNEAECHDIHHALSLTCSVVPLFRKFHKLIRPIMQLKRKREFRGIFPVAGEA
jgi:hypothetical protein